MRIDGAGDALQAIGLAADLAGVLLVAFFSLHFAHDRERGQVYIEGGRTGLEKAGWILLVVGFALQLVGVLFF